VLEEFRNLNSKVEAYYFETIMKYKSIEISIDENDPRYVEEKLGFLNYTGDYAKLVNKSCKDLLTGDFSIFKSISTDLKKNNINLLPNDMKEIVLTMPEYSVGIHCITVELDNKTEYARVYVAWGEKVVGVGKIGISDTIVFDPARVIKVENCLE